MAPDLPLRIRQAALSARRSPLYQWMVTHFDKFALVVDEAGRPNWQALAKAFGEEGLTDLRNNPPTAEGARQTWFKVRQAVAKRRARPATRSGDGLFVQTTAAAAERQPAPLSGWVAPPPLPASGKTITPVEHETPRERKRMVLRSPKPLAEGEPWPDDGSKLPKPLRNS